MDKTMAMIRILLVGIGCIVLIAMWCIIETQEANKVYVYIQDPNSIPSAKEIQQRLKALGKPRYDPGKIDGVIGVETKSQIAWDNYECDQHAKRAIEGE